MSGTALCTLVHPTITAVEQPVEQMAEEACRLLMEHIADSGKKAEDVVLRGDIKERESTAVTKDSATISENTEIQTKKYLEIGIV